jgi:hypothetical protein
MARDRQWIHIAYDHLRAARTVDQIGDALLLLSRGSTVPVGAAEAPTV